jgi:hypothetical protein
MPEAQRRCQHAKPAHVVARPVDACQRQADDLNGSAAAAIQLLHVSPFQKALWKRYE